jgi:hypothetical protein
MRFPTPYDQLMAGMEMRIITNGYTIQGVLPDDDCVGWTYTIGLAESFDLPELVITNIDNRIAASMLTWAVEQLQDGADLDDLDPTQFTAVPVHHAHLNGEVMNMWREHYGEEPSSVDVMQLQLGQEFGCPCCITTQVDLSDPTATLDRSRRLNRAQRRALRKRGK